MELYKKYRPKTLKGVLGQNGAISSLSKQMEKGKIPHAILFTGPSGCGKTTIARILKDVLECNDSDFTEINSADFKGIDTVRSLRSSVNYSPIGGGKCKMYLIDEAHKMTNDAQNALLKILEDTPGHVYFMLCTTDPQKIIAAIHTRCSEVKLNRIDETSIKTLIQRVLTKENVTLDEEVITDLVEAADGSARKALVILDQIIAIEGKAAQLEAIQSTTLNKDLALSLARVLINKNAKWAEASAILSQLSKEDPEGVRYCVLGYARSCLLKGGSLGQRSFAIIEIFAKNFYDSKQAGLAAACWEVIHNAP